MSNCSKLKEGGEIYKQIHSLTNNDCYFEDSTIDSDEKKRRKKNYRKLSLSVHPDKHSDCKKEYEELFKYLSRL